MISKGCIEIIKGTDWESVLFPKPLSFEHRLMLKRHERFLDENYPEEGA